MRDTEIEQIAEWTVVEPKCHDAVLQYIEELLLIQRELSNLEGNLFDVSIGKIGIRRKDLRECQERYNEISNRVSRADVASIDQFALLDIDHVNETDIVIEDITRDFNLNQPIFDNQLDQIHEIHERIGRELTNKEQTANTLLGLFLSVTAILVSSISILISLFTPP